MKRFVYPLDRVRHWRLEQAEVEEMHLRQRVLELGALEMQQQQLIDESEQAQRAANAADPGEMMQLGLYRRHMQMRIEMAGQRIREQQVKVDQQRQRVVEARRQFELLNKLRQKSLGEWMAAYGKEQEDLAAELYLSKRARDAT